MIGHHYFFFIFVVLLLLFFDGIAVSALVSAFKIGLLEFRAELLELFVGLFEVVVVVKLQRLLLRVTSSWLVVAYRANGIGTFVTISGVPVKAMTGTFNVGRAVNLDIRDTLIYISSHFVFKLQESKKCPIKLKSLES